ncbi:hypothetical protein BJP36_41080 [Moorena producens JHB]|uniref:Uncharacterized protein n=1 Tax=Moorena producens (strain JHB) TaxID=1454205 RepID=A0A9Q9UVF6_MOOP1|nr:hypothetical protein [Moorena producens]WAN68761.1 hypothetical protein BJP36_41080 [Moorena producens JHB]
MTPFTPALKNLHKKNLHKTLPSAFSRQLSAVSLWPSSFADTRHADSTSSSTICSGLADSLHIAKHYFSLIPTSPTILQLTSHRSVTSSNNN